MKSLLITGFDPFAHYIVNPSWKAVKALPDIVGDYQLYKLMLPNIFDLEAKILLEEAGRVKPDVILLCGMNSGSTRLQLNLAALNIRDAFLEDNLGHRPWGVPIREGAPDAYFATIPVHIWCARCEPSILPLIWRLVPVALSAMIFFILLCMLSTILILKLALCMYRCCRKW